MPRTMPSAHARKIFKIGNSFAVVIPPHVMDHLAAKDGDFLVWDISVPGFGVLHVGHVPPYVSHPTMFDDSNPDSG